MDERHAFMPLLVALTICLACGTAVAATRNVPGDYATIQAAIDAALNGDEVVIAPGTYRERIDFGGKGIVVRSTDPSSPSVVAATTLDGDHGGCVVTCCSSETPASVLSGLTITNGLGSSHGGGIYCEGSSPTIVGNAIRGNTSNTLDGGGIYCRRGGPTIRGNTISGNVASSGGGIFCSESAANISSNTISGNLTRGSSSDGGGIYCYKGNPTISHNVISGNGAHGIASFYSRPTISGNTISGNAGGIAIAAYHYSAGNPDTWPITLYNNIICSSTVEGVRLGAGTAPIVKYCNVNANNGNDYVGMGDPTGTNGNISCDPLFADAPALDFRLKSRGGRWNGTSWVVDAVSSPCIDAGDPTADCSLEPMPNGGRVNMGSDGNTPYASKSNSAPTVPSAVAITPTNPTCTDTLEADAFGGTDPEGTIPTYKYEWAQGMGPWGHACTDGVLTGVTLHKGEVWRVHACATDGELDSHWTSPLDVTIANSAPTAPTVVSVCPQHPRTLTDLRASAGGGSDADGDTLIYQYQWSSRTGPEGQWSAWVRRPRLLSNTLTTLGEEWRVRSRCYDGTICGRWRVAAPVTIENTPPTPPATVAVKPTSPGTNRDLVAIASGSTDADGTTLIYKYQWARMAAGSSTWGLWGYGGRVLDQAETSPGDRWKARARAHDGIAFGVWKESLAVTISGPATPPTVAAAAAVCPSGTVHVTVALTGAATVQVSVLNLAGREVAVLPEWDLPRGLSTLLWDGRSMSGTRAPGGRYLIGVTARGDGGGQARALVPLSLDR